MLYERTDHRFGSIPFSPNWGFGLFLGVLTVWLAFDGSEGSDKIACYVFVECSE
jgi:hypothetical protein